MRVSSRSPPAAPGTRARCTRSPTFLEPNASGDLARLPTERSRPMIRKLLPLTFAIAAAATLRLGAGGWAVVTVDTLPESVVAATPVRLSFTVRQHGQTLVDGLQPKVTAVADKDQVCQCPASRTVRDDRCDVDVPTPGRLGHHGRQRLRREQPADAAALARRRRREPRRHAADRRGTGTPAVRGQRVCHLPSEQSRVGNTSLGFAPALVAGQASGWSACEHPPETGSGAGRPTPAGRRHAEPEPPA